MSPREGNKTYHENVFSIGKNFTYEPDISNMSNARQLLECILYFNPNKREIAIIYVWGYINKNFFVPFGYMG